MSAGIPLQFCSFPNTIFCEFLGASPYACTACQWLEGNLQIWGLPFLWFHAFQDFTSHFPDTLAAADSNLCLFRLAMISFYLCSTSPPEPWITKCAQEKSQLVCGTQLLCFPYFKGRSTSTSSLHLLLLSDFNNFLICPAFTAVIGGGGGSDTRVCIMTRTADPPPTSNPSLSPDYLPAKYFLNPSPSLHLHSGHAFSSSFFFFLCFVFLGPYLQHMEVPRLGVELELQLPAYTPVTNVGSLTHWARPGIESATSCFLVRFISTEPWQERQGHGFDVAVA